MASPLFGTGWEDDSLDVLWQDGERVFCRLWGDSAEGERYAFIPVLSEGESPAVESIKRLEHEFELKGYLDSAWALLPVELVRERRRTMLIVGYTAGEPLDRLIGQPMEIEQFLRLAASLAATLGRLHARGLIHKDIKPANVITNPSTGQVWLTGFGIASRLPRERQSPEPPEFIAGTLPYMAPEQTGRMNRSIDTRSDLYALGVTLYQMLAGALPFTAADPMEWVHCHIAKRAAAPHERVPGIPEPLSLIVMKLLAKAAEDRYQTAAGLESDLRRTLAGWQATGEIADFRIGERDTPDRLLVPEKLYGRAREVEILLASFDRMVNTGTTELVLVSGYSGIGKSSVVNELHKVLVPPRGLFASGKFDQYKRDVPYATLVQAFQGLILRLLGKNDAELHYWREALTDALGSNAQLIVNLIPELKLVVGQTPPTAELPSQEAKRRFHLVFRRFIAVFARAEHPLALFLDDLQWLDAATLDLLEDLLLQRDTPHLLLIGAYRDNEVTTEHRLMKKLDGMRKAGASIQNIVLSPLAHGDLGQLLADSLHCELNRVGALARLVHEKTDGNPFFAVQFLYTLADEALVTFDHGDARWSWELDRIRAKRFTENVVDLMVAKLTRLPAITRQVLEQLACIGNNADFGLLGTVCRTSAEEARVNVSAAVAAGLLLQTESSCSFQHDRIREAAYSLIPQDLRAKAHLRIGRLLTAHLPAEKLHEMVFEVVNQLNEGAQLVSDSKEKRLVAELNLRAARRAKASSAYASACVYLSQAANLLGSFAWTSCYDLTFAVWLERAECELLVGQFAMTEQLLNTLLARSSSNINKAAVLRLKIDLHVMKSENAQAVDSALEALRLLGIDLPAHPAKEDVQAEYEAVWVMLEGRPITELLDLPLASKPETQAAMRILSALFAPALFTDVNLFYLHLCRAVTLTLRLGITDATAAAYVRFGVVLGPQFHRYTEGYEFGKLACELVERHNLVSYRARTHLAMEYDALWTQPISTGLRYLESAFRCALETGDMTTACYTRNHEITDCLLRGDPLKELRLKTEVSLQFVRDANFRDVAAVIESQQRFILNMLGSTFTFSSFSGPEFDEGLFEAALGKDRITTMVCWYWILKLQARFISGDYAAAWDARDKADTLLWSSVGHIQLLDYYFYSTLTAAALWEGASSDLRDELRALFTRNLEQLREWADECSATFRDKYELAAAEVARIEGRDLEAMRLYDRAIRSARESGFVHNEAIASELASRFYAAGGFEEIAAMYLLKARSGYLQWGAQGKVRQLDRIYPHCAGLRHPADPSTRIDEPLDRLDLATVTRISEAVSATNVWEDLLNTLMRTAIAQTGAERGVLVMCCRDGERIRAEASVEGDGVAVQLRDALVTAARLPVSVLQYALRTRETVMLDDAASQSLFAADPYIQQRRARSVLCLPLMSHAKLGGVLYLENNLASRAFAPGRIAAVKFLASQAAIALESAQLYRDLAEREAKIRRLVEANIIGIFICDFQGRILEANDAFLAMVGYDREDLASRALRWTDLTPPEWLRRDQEELVPRLMETGRLQPFEKELFRKDGLRVSVLIGVASFEVGGNEGVAFVLDLTERKRAADALRELHTELAHANRLATMGQLAASVAHEVNQPIGAAHNNARAALRFLAAKPPELGEVAEALECVVKETYQAGDIIGRIRDQIKKAAPRREGVDLNGAIEDVIALVRGELSKHRVSLRTELAAELPLVTADRVQLQQVILNLILNAIEAMVNVEAETRELLISTASQPGVGVLVAVGDSGPGVDPAYRERIFESFYTTKAGGLGIGLSICRSIMEVHRGRLWVEEHQPRGAVFRFTMPARE